MRRIVKLKGELIIFLFLSLAISLTVAIGIKTKGTGFYRTDSTKRIDKIYAECITDLEKELNNRDLNNIEDVQKLMDEKYGLLVGYSFYVVDELGKVIVTSNTGIDAINLNKIQDGMREYVQSKTDQNVFKITGCDYLKDGYYLYYVYLRYGQDDTGMLFYALIGAIVCFFLFIWGRISYISTIKESVDNIANGNLNARVPIKYQNELRELADGINSMASELEKEELKRNEFITNISHDIRTPLTTILGYLDMIKNERYDSKEELDTYLTIIERKGKFLAQMMEDFFQYSKLVSQDILINQASLNLNELARQLYEDEESEFEERNLKLVLNLSKKPIYFTGDSELFARAVNNLLSNAIKYSKPDTIVEIKSSVETINNENYAMLSLSNIPREEISKEEVDMLFERLYKKDQSRSEEGSGLGLSIVKQIMNLHGGEVKGYKEKDRLVFKLLIRN